MNGTFNGIRLQKITSRKITATERDTTPTFFLRTDVQRGRKSPTAHRAVRGA